MRLPRLLKMTSFGVLMFGLGCQQFCPDEPIARVAPKLTIGDPFDAEATVCNPDDRFTECAYNFGEVNVGEGRFLKVVLENRTQVKLLVDTIEVEGDPAFSLEGNPFAGEDVITIETNSTTKVEEGTLSPTIITVRYVPVVEGEGQQATLKIWSDAVNFEDPDNQGTYFPLEIKLTGTGIDNGRPEVVVEPAECDFGEVGLAAKAYCDISVKNVGARDLQITGVDFLDATTFPSVFNAETIVPIPSFIAPGTALSIRFSATPSSPQLQRNDFVLSTNDPLKPEVTVPLKVLGAEAPTAIARVLAINNVPNNQATPDIRPLDDVVLTGEDSVPAQVNGSIVTYSWSIEAQPQQSTVILSSPDAMTTGFEFNSAQGIVSGLDVAGEYVVRLTVTDDSGLTSTNDARVNLNAVPSEALHIELTWESPNWDLDLHMVKDGAAYCSTSSCYYANCKPGAAGYPEWDGVGGRGGGDPVLDIDDLNGYGPENINIDEPEEGVYRAAVHTFSAGLNEDVGVTLKVYVNGALAYDDYRIMGDGGDMWEVVEISWANGVPTVFPINQYDGAGGGCPSF